MKGDGKRGNREGSFRQRGDRWEGAMYVKEIGKRVTVTASTKPQARKALQEKVKLISKGAALARRSDQTFGQYAEHVISTRSKLSNRTRDLYRSQVRLYCRPLRDMKLDQITSDTLTALYRDIQAGCTWDERGRKQPGHKARKVRVAQIAHSVIRLTLQTALTRGLIAQNPATMPDVRPEVSKSDLKKHDEEQGWDDLRAWNEAQATRILEAAGRVTNGSILAFLLLSGMRKGEALALTWEHYDLQAGVVKIRGTRSPSDGKIYTDRPKTARSIRDLKLTDEARGVLTDVWVKCGSPTKPSDRKRHIFLNTAGKPMPPATVNVTLTRCLNLLDKERDEGSELMPRLTVHSLRHTFVSLMAAAGYQPQQIGKWIGDSTETVLRFYLHVFRENSAMPSMGIGSFHPQT